MYIDKHVECARQEFENLKKGENWGIQSGLQSSADIGQTLLSFSVRGVLSACQPEEIPNSCIY